MLELDEIKQSFPKEVHDRSKAMIREYLQTKILKAIFESKLAHKLTFIGGTALRIIYNIKRFSEDLDFDNKNLSLEEWSKISEEIQSSISKLGIEINSSKIRVNDTVFHSNLRFPGIFFQYGISPHKNETLLIKTDSQNQGIKYEENITELNKFDVRSMIKVMPLDVALSQKFRAFFDREMGRDLFDISSLCPQTKPNYNYLKQAINIESPEKLKKEVLKKCKSLNINKMVTRTMPFLFTKDSVNHIKYFPEYIESYSF